MSKRMELLFTLTKAQTTTSMVQSLEGRSHISDHAALHFGSFRPIRPGIPEIAHNEMASLIAKAMSSILLRP